MNDNNKKIIKTSVLVITVFAIVLSVTYAFINITLRGEKKQVITAGNLDLVLDEDDNNLTITNALPMYDEVGMKQDPFTFRIINNTTTDTNYILKLTNITTGDALDTTIVKYGLTKNGVGEPALLSTLPADGTVDSGTIGNKETIEYTLRLWIDASVTNNSVISGKSLSYRVDLKINQEIEEIRFVDQLEEKADTTTTINFNMISSATNGRGIYKYTEDGQDVYYWRGKVTDNHVIFAGYCWEAIRTTKTGGLKMIYDGVPDTNGYCKNTSWNSQLSNTVKFNDVSPNAYNAYVGYMYGLPVTAELTASQCIKLNSSGTAAEVGTETTEKDCVDAGGKWVNNAYEATHANIVDSTIKKEIETWFETSTLNKEENLKKIEDAVYCNDRSISGSGLGYGSNNTDYMARYRLETKTTKTPSLECSRNDDRFTVNTENGNGKLRFPVGLLTADEIALAGGVYNSANTEYYLYTGTSYYALSPFYASKTSYAFVTKVYSLGGQLEAVNYKDKNGVRPVITLLSNVEISGSGTTEKPYIVE